MDKKKKNSKLESFLKRTLPAQVYSDIRYYEGCVVRVGKAALAYSYVVITGKSLLLADYPPRSVQEAVQLSDLTSISVEHDWADFLKGPQRDSCQHVKLCHRKQGLQDVREEVTSPLSALHEDFTRPLSVLREDSSPALEGVGTPEPDAAPRSRVRDSPDISALLRKVERAKPHIPRSRSSLAQYSLPQGLELANVNRRAYSSLDKPRIRRAPEVEALLGPEKLQFFPENEIHIYILQGTSALLNQLQSCWCSRLLSSTLEIAGGKMGSLSGNRDMQQLETVYQRYKRELLDPDNSADHCFDLLHELHVGLQRNIDLKKVFWKDQMLYHFLTQRLHFFLCEPQTTINELDSDRVLTSRIEELEAAALLLDILLITLQDSDCLLDKIQMLQFNGGIVLKSLLELILTPPNIPHRYRNTCSRMLEDFHEFSSSGWNNLPEAELIRLLAEVTNISTAILYELLLTLRNSDLKLAKLLEGVTLECHLKRSITLLLGLLFPIQPHRLKPLEAVLVYQHFYVLKCLMETLTRVRDFVKEQFQEEFRYYIHWSRVGRRMSDNYPVKRLLRQLVEDVHQMASSKHIDTFS